MLDKGSLEQRLFAAVEAARMWPEVDGHWDELENLAAAAPTPGKIYEPGAQPPEQVAALYREVLGAELPTAVAAKIGARAVRFHDEWFGDDSSALIEVLSRVIGANPREEAALSRLTMLLAVGSRWDDLLGVYDRAIAAAPDDPARRVHLLEEALHVAKDFAAQPDRAIRYLQQLVPEKRGDTQLASSLERLLEKQERWADLIALWKAGVPDLPAEEARAARERIATYCLEKVGDAATALAEIEALLAAGLDGTGAYALLERIVGLTTTSPEVRLGALSILRSRYDGAGKTQDVVRVLELALGSAGADEQADLHHETGERLAALGQAREGMDHFIAELVLSPSAPFDPAALRALATRASSHERYVEGLLEAAKASPAGARRAALLVEAGDVRAADLRDPEGASALYKQALAETGADVAASLRIARQLSDLLEQAGRGEDQLDVLERLATLEPSGAHRSEAMRKAARLAERLGDTNRAQRIWTSRLELDPGDLEALDAVADLLEREKQWAPLIEVLLQRAEAPGGRLERRAALVRVGKVHAEKLGALEAAITTWTEIAKEFGEDLETVDALADLLSETGRWTDLVELLERSGSRETAHLARVLSRLGDAQRDRLDAPELAASSYQRALEADPAHAQARAGLTALLEHGPSRADAAAALARAFEVTKDWSGLLDILEPRLASSASPAEQARILREAAGMQEQRAGDRAAALRCIGRALVMAPYDLDLERELHRLSAATGDDQVAARAYHEAARTIVDAPSGSSQAARAAHLRRLEGALLEQRLDDRAGALEAYLEATRLDPTHAGSTGDVVRVAARVGRWSDAARAFVASSRTRGSIDEALFGELEAAVSESDAWSDAAKALEAATASDPDRAAGSADELPAGIAHTLQTRIAAWYRDKAGDLEATEAALLRALAHDVTRNDTRRDLAAIQRKNPGPRLLDTLLVLADTSSRDLDALHEAAQVALGLPAAADAAGQAPASLARSVLRRLLDEAARLWRRGDPGAGTIAPATAAAWALDQLVRLATETDEHAAALDLLVEGLALPFEDAAWRELGHRAARIAATKREDTARAADLYRRILERAPGDERAIHDLAAIYEAGGRVTEILALRRHELELSPSLARRLELRLEIARLVGALEDRGGRVEALRANLEESPGHDGSIEEICGVFDAKSRYVELADLLTEQATRVQALGETSRAAVLWAKTAVLAESRLGDLERAKESHRRVAALAPTAETFDALARIHAERGEHAEAARWLERRLEAAPPDSRVEIALRLARAHTGAGQQARAIACLERTLAKEPKARRLRDLLADLYRSTEAWAPLAKLLADACAHAPDDATLLAYVREAASLHHQKLHTPDQAITMLEQALRVIPDDRWVRATLADGLCAAKRFDEARAILEALIADFGRRRSSDRASAHRQLAQVLRAEGRLDEALAQLDLASSMNLGDPVILAMLGSLARDAKQLDRAEQAYRALLLVVRRKESDALEDVGTSEVLYALSRIAAERGQTPQADELCKSAIELASQSAVEARRFKRAVLAEGQAELMVRALEMRLGAKLDLRAQGEVLADLADLLEAPLGRLDEALDARLRALEISPESAELHASSRRLAARMGQTPHYLDRVSAIIDTRRRKEEARLVSELTLRLADATEQDAGDLARAAELYARVEAMGEHPALAKAGLAKVAGMRGVSSEQRRRLEEIISLPGVSEEARADALYRLADIDIPSADAREQGLRSLEDAIMSDPQYERAATILRDTAFANFDDAALWALYQRVARASGDDAMLLDYLERRAGHPTVTLVELREGIEIAQKLAESSREEALLELAIDRAKQMPGGLADSLWAPIALADRRREAGDIAGTIRWLRAAADVAGDDAAFGLREKAAELAAAQGGDLLPMAVEIFEQLLERDATAATIWEPLLDVHRRLGNHDRVGSLVRSTLDALLDPIERNALRMEHARFSLSQGRQAETATMLRDVLVEDPEHAEAAGMLAELLERTGDTDGLADLLARQLDAARDRRDAPAVAALALRSAAVLEPTRREDAMDVLRGALEWVPGDRAVLEALLRLFTDDDDARERAERMEQLLALETGQAGAELARKLASIWKTLDDDAGIQRALEAGYRIAPEDDAHRDRLDAWYRGREDWAGLAQLLKTEAARRGASPAAIAAYRNAAAIQLDRLQQPAAAAVTLRAAAQLAPDDVGLLNDLVACRKAAGELTEAIAEIGAALERSPRNDASTPLLRMRAEIHQALGQHAEAVSDLEQAFTINGTEGAPALLAGLEAWRDAAALAGDRKAQRAAALRLVEVLVARSESDAGRDVLAAWLETEPSDHEAVHKLLEIDTAAGRWGSVAESCGRLIALEKGGDQIDAAVLLVEACDRANDPGAARVGLERAFADQPSSEVLRKELGRLYERVGAHRELASLMLASAAEVDDAAECFKLLRQAGDLLLHTVGDADAALEPLRKASALRPEDLEAAILLIDACTAAGHRDEAARRIETSIAAHGKRRSPELALLQHRMARIAQTTGDTGRQLEWLAAALDMDRNNGDVSADLADLALSMGDDDMALKALRAVTLLKTPGRMSRAVAFLRQAQIAQRQGDPQKALLFARRARAEDGHLVEVTEFLKQLGEG